MEHKMITVRETQRNWSAPGAPTHQSAGRCRWGQLKWLAFLALVLAAMAILPRPAAAMDATLNVADGNPNFTADQINPGQSTTAEFVATPYAGSPNGQGHPAPTIRSESFSVTVDKYTTIGEISGLPEGAVVKHSRPITDPSSGDTTETFSISGKVPSSVFNISIGLTCSKSTPTGTSHPVTLKPVSIATKQAAGTCGRAATESYAVEVLAVDIMGPPYVIIDNAPNQGHAAAPPSQYTAYVMGGSGHYTWQWKCSHNIHEVSRGTSSPNKFYGHGPVGHGVISCTVTDRVTGATETGYRHPYVQDWFQNLGICLGPTLNAFEQQQPATNSTGSARNIGFTYQCLTSYSNTFNGDISLSAGEIAMVKSGIGYSSGSSDGTVETITASIDVPPHSTMDIYHGPGYLVTVYHWVKNSPSSAESFFPSKQVYEDYHVYFSPALPNN